MEIKELLKTIMGLAFEVNSRNKNTIFINFEGHVEVIQVIIYENGWSKDAEITEMHSIYLSGMLGENAKEELEKVIEKLKELTRTANQD